MTLSEKESRIKAKTTRHIYLDDFSPVKPIMDVLQLATRLSKRKR